MRSRIVVPILALTLLAGCGGDPSDEDAVRAVVTEGVKSGDAGVCDRLLTEEFLIRNLGPDGIEQCKRLRKGQEGRVKGFRIESARVAGDRAEVRVTSETFGRERYVLVKDGDGWRISGTERL